jgi:predicted phage terminase large subunit-like protein
MEDVEAGDVSRLPKFDRVFTDWDTSFKDKSTSDYVAGGVWGVKGADHYLLKVWHDRLALSATKTSMKDARRWILDRWPGVQVYVVIEKAANGVEILEQLKREITGCVAFTASTDKVSRAEAAEPAFDSGNVWVPGVELGSLGDYDPARTPAWVQILIEECATFPAGAHDDLVDMVTMAINWNRTKNLGPTTVGVPRGRRVTVPTSPDGQRAGVTGRRIVPRHPGLS